ncbi:MAG: hypothetical protein RDU20_08460 [Desulfomonilaceae bacterium]|nr:hypothetical protein [Desulfomonilaceae bacterium]
MYWSIRLPTLLLAMVLVSIWSIGWAAEPVKRPQRDLPPGQETEAAGEIAGASGRSDANQPGAESPSQETKSAVSASPQTIELASDQTQMFATKMLNEIIEGILEGDYHKYTRNLSPEMRKFQTRQVFLELQQKLQKNLGKLHTLTYLGFYDQLGKRLGLFKARFEKDKDDALITIVLDIKDKEPKASGLWFDAPALEKR